jgi:homoserine kinase type II
MTVWTQVTLDEVNNWLDTNYKIKAKTILPIAEGVEDSVFRLDTTDDKAVFLRIFERTEPLGPLSIAAHLADVGLPTCPPMIDANGMFFSTLKDKPAALFPWIDGAWVAEPNLQQIADIGAFMGRIARDGAQQCDGWTRENPRGWQWFADTAQKLLPVLPALQSLELEDEVEKQLAFWKTVDRAEVRHGPVHADAFRNNVMFRADGSLAAVIDWGFCASDYPFIYDLAIVANDWCLKDGTHTLDPQKLTTLIDARTAECPFTPAEEDAWGMALRLAALRFYLSRQHDASFPRGELGKTLDPDHFRKIMQVHRCANEGIPAMASRPLRRTCGKAGSQLPANCR